MCKRIKIVQQIMKQVKSENIASRLTKNSLVIQTNSVKCLPVSLNLPYIAHRSSAIFETKQMKA
jgi:hypothetical protein